PTISKIKIDNIDSQTIPQLFLEQFYKVYTNAIPVLPDQDTPKKDPIFDHALIFITDEDIFKVLGKLPLKINNSPDFIPLYLLNQCAVSLAAPIGIILRRSFLIGKVPNLWKCSIVKPVPKSTSTEINDFRPISLTYSVSKIAEKCILIEI